MARTLKSLLSASVLILLGSVTVGHAETLKLSGKTIDGFNTQGDFNPRSAQLSSSTKSTLQFDATKGRWGVKLDMDQPVERDMQLEDVRAGAFFKVTPSLRVGGAVSLGDQSASALARKAQPLQEATPRVRLETAFKF